VPAVPLLDVRLKIVYRVFLQLNSIKLALPQHVDDLELVVPPNHPTPGHPPQGLAVHTKASIAPGSPAAARVSIQRRLLCQGGEIGSDI